MKSPCTKVCVMDEGSGLCKGCKRTLEEIGRWGRMTDAERDAVMQRLEQRKSDVAEVPVPPLA
jgi:predicted Fe-S protein YdhL (DUF1289 family)